VLSIIGLSLDVVGAVVLVFGLFRPVGLSTYGGDYRPPEDVARDASFGLIGAPLLALGFVFQSLTYFHLRYGVAPLWGLTIAAMTITGAAIAAWIAYRLMYPRLLRRAQSQREAALKAARAGY
jgi:hypothetical protein